MQAIRRHPLLVPLILTAGYIMLQMTADVTAAKMITLSIFGLAVSLPAGSFIYAFTFTWRDMIHKKLGRNAARIIIILAALTNIAMALYFVFVIKLPFPTWWVGQEAIAFVLGQVPRIVLASIAAELVSELLDTELYHFWVRKVTTKYQWSRVLWSNLWSGPVDSLIFGTIAFGGVLPLAALAQIIVGQVVVKWGITLISLPGIYFTPGRGLVFHTTDAGSGVPD